MFREKREIAPLSVQHEGFRMTRPNINKKTVQFKCAHQRKGAQKGGGCKATVSFHHDKDTGLVDYDNSRNNGQHTRSCCIVNGVDPESYDWEGKSPSGLSDGVSGMNFDDSGPDPDFGDAYAASERENANPNVIISGKRHTYILSDILTRSLFLNTDNLFLIQK